MSSPESVTSLLEFTKQYEGIKPPLGVQLPRPEDVLSDICTKDLFRSSFAYPPEAPICWIKYGRSVYWNEVCAQVMAYYELRRLQSLVRVPGIFYAFEDCPMTYIVMEYIPGKTAGQCLKETQDQARREDVYRSIALALSELHRIPIANAAASRPAAVGGGMIRHTIFDDLEAPRHYENVQQLEDHINAFLKLTTKRGQVVHHLAREPLVFCQSDLFPGNFILDDHDHSRITAIDFSDASILSSGFAKHALHDHRLGFDISEWVYVPTIEGVANLEPLRTLSGRIVIGSYSFAKMGKRMPGGDPDTQRRIGEMVENPEIESEATTDEEIGEGKPSDISTMAS